MTDGPSAPATPRSSHPAFALLANQKVRYLFFGSLNTALAYGLYLGFLWALDLAGVRWDYVLATTLSWIVSNVTSFALQRRFVFAAEGPLVPQFLRFTSVTLGSFGANLALGVFAVEVLGLTTRNEKAVSQLVITGILVVVTFFLHRGFSFRRRA